VSPERGVRAARFHELDPATLYAILRLRVDAFVVEQACAYPDLDGLDTEPSRWHLWVPDEAGVPVLGEPDGTARISRVVTHPSHRGRGLAAALVSEALARCPATVVLNAQSHLAGWYTRFGFEVDGPEFLEDGIPHTPMRRR
jgi:ElaA protein